MKTLSNLKLKTTNIIEQLQIPTFIKRSQILAFGLICFFYFISFSVGAQKVEKLEQWANGKLAPEIVPVGWVTGNVVPSKAHYTEGMTLPYHLEAIDLVGGESYCITIAWDTKKNGKNALDYLTSYNTDFNHSRFGHPIEEIDPLINTLLFGTEVVFDSKPIPAPSFPGAGPVLEQAFLEFNNTPSIDKQIRVYNAAIDTMYYAFEGDLTGPTTTTFSSLRICFTVNSGASSVVLTWGAHIATQQLWGEGKSAVDINGSPYHTFLDDCDGPYPEYNVDDLVGCGNKEVQLSAAAVNPLPHVEISVVPPSCPGDIITLYGLTNNVEDSFLWSIEPDNDNSGAAIIGSSTNDSLVVQVGEGGSITAYVTVFEELVGGTLMDSDTAVIIVPTSILTNIIGTNLSCYDDSSGSADLTVSGGAPPYTYLWSNGAITEDLSNLSIGQYDVLVTDTNGCIARDTVIISQPNPVVALEQHDEIQCFGGSADVTISASGGTAPYSGTGVFSQAVGSQDYIVIDANGCSDTVNVTLSQPSQLVASEQHDEIQCFGESADVTISASGGTGPYSGTGVFSQAVGSQDYIVIDANGCRDTVNVNLSQPDLLVASEQHDEIQCFGESADVTISAVGGTGPYSGTGVFSQAVGSQDYIVIDANGCRDTVNVNLSQPDLLVASEQHDEIQCFGGSADVTISAVGGTGPYSGTGVFSQAVGSQDYIVIDANGCRDTVNVNLSQPDLLTAEISKTDLLCNGDGSGTASVSPQGGTEPYVYLWNTGDTTQGIQGLSAQEYSVLITDTHGCDTLKMIVLIEPAKLQSDTSGSDLVCNGDNSGSASVTVVGGTPPYSYEWNNGDTIKDITGLSAGLYTVNFEDANGCLGENSIQINEPDLLVASEQHDEILCYGGSADVTISAVGGTGPYSGTGVFSQAEGTVNYIVIDAHGCRDTVTVKMSQPSLLVANKEHDEIQCFGESVDVTISAVGGTGPYSGTGVFSQAAGSQDYIVIDANGCRDTVNVNLSQPDLLVASEQHDEIQCYGESANVTISAVGGTGPYSGTGVFSQAVGSQDYIVIDANGCRDTVNVNLSQPDLLVASEQHDEIQCFGESADVTISAVGGTGPYSGTGVFSQAVGSQDYIVIDANGCRDTVNVNLSQPDLLVASEQHDEIQCYGESADVTISAVGGTGPYSGTGVFSQAVGSQDYIVIDANGCRDTVNVNLSQPDLLVASEQHDEIQCYGESADVTISAVGGTGPYSGTGVFSQAVGSQAYIVIDANGCRDTVNVTLSQPSLLVASEQHDEIQCFGESADVTISAVGGTGPYSGTGVFSQAAGSQDYIVIDANGCRDTVNVNLSQPDPLEASEMHGKIQCFGGTAQVTVVAVGGTPPYSGIGIFQQLAGTVDYAIVDANGCKDTVSVTLDQPDSLVILADVSEIDCYGEEARVEISATGGTAPYSGIGLFSQAVGSTDYIVTDAKGCKDTITVTLDQPDPLVASAEHDDILCHGESVDVVISATGGTILYLGTGTYTQYAGTVNYVVTDANECRDTVTVTLVQPDELSCEITPPQETPICNSEGNLLYASTIGGTGVYSYSWAVESQSGTWEITDGQDESIVTYTAGNVEESATFILTVTDENGCESICRIEIACEFIGNAHCTMTQGFYGNEGGLYCDGRPTTQVISDILSLGPIYIGNGPTNELTLLQGDAPCIINRLPGGGKEKAISTGPNTCLVAPGISQRLNGRFKNTLVAQTITLSLNLGLDPTLGSFELGGNYMVTAEADSCNYIEAEEVPFTLDTFYIPLVVIEYLGEGATVNDLLQLANDALGGNYSPVSNDDPSLGDITAALGGYNDGFDECRVFIEYYLGPTPRKFEGDDNATVKAYPNPFDDNITFEFEVAYEGDAKLQIYDMSGHLIKTIYEDVAVPNVKYLIRYSASELVTGMYMYKFNLGSEFYTGQITMVK